MWEKVYLISDMYYKLQDIKHLLDKCGVTIPDDEHIWISCEKNVIKYQARYGKNILNWLARISSVCI